MKHKIVTCVFATVALCRGCRPSARKSGETGIQGGPEGYKQEDQNYPLRLPGQKLIKAYDLDFGDGTQMGVS